MHLSDLITCPDDVLVVSGENKVLFLEDIAGRIAKLVPETNAHELFDALLKREAFSSTGIGDGIALPHARLKNLLYPRAFLVKLKNPLAFDAVDQKPVDLMVVLLTLDGDNATHLRILSRISRVLRDSYLCSKMRRTEDKNTLYTLLFEEGHTQKAA